MLFLAGSRRASIRARMQCIKRMVTPSAEYYGVLYYGVLYYGVLN